MTKHLPARITREHVWINKITDWLDKNQYKLIDHIYNKTDTAHVLRFDIRKNDSDEILQCVISFSINKNHDPIQINYWAGPLEDDYYFTAYQNRLPTDFELTLFIHALMPLLILLAKSSKECSQLSERLRIILDAFNKEDIQYLTGDVSKDTAIILARKKSTSSHERARK